MSTTDTPTPATSLQQAMATLDSDIAAALARFAGAVNGTDSPLVEGEGEHLTDAAFASVCATCTDLTPARGEPRRHRSRGRGPLRRGSR